ncbi:RING/FYVE/PHD ZINC FINGER SUPERFAMILY PROTEIN [Salix koriyanagi]|uniref:RING/FYVE/PHD ZINC FINGER SUPERFAMILY PROTEIN n=1 Tax=Salix koriyanagi TaxID=2511006 RepID=A0A9Q0ZBF3_9ROSI|nr:RING/FYVE/PHD ZINC FINGER SUPERFAMILY PROTEIN [Salix koriyanagi]
MDTKFQASAPLKRHTLLKQQQQHQEHEENVPFSSQLPAKKRKESRNPLLADADPKVITSAAYCLPTKKRVWALHPDLVSGKPLSPLIDLNVEYIPSFSNEGVEADEENEKTPLPITTINNTDGDPTDPIVFCDGCDLMVHATCYGNPLIKGVPDGDWFCSPCLASKSDRESKQPSLSCCLCPIKGGALKSTAANGRDESWAHIVCALLIPEVFFENPDGREGIDCSKIPKRRWEGKCYVCKSRKGCVIDCSEPKCHLAFHVTCGLNEDVCIDYKEGKKETIVAGFCKRHTELWDKQQQTGKFKIVAREEHRK